MKLFITHTFKGNENKSEIENLCNLVNQSGWQDFSFIRDVENFQKKFQNSKTLMSTARQAITECDALLFDLSDPSVGKGIELGIAYRLGKKIIIIKKPDTEIRNTVIGCADLVIDYTDISQITKPLSEYLSKLTNASNNF